MIQTEIEQNKSNLDYLVPAHMIRLVVKDLGRAFDAFFDKKRSDVHHPKFKDLNDHVTGSYKDDQACIKNGKLRLTKGILDSNDYSLIRTKPKLPDQQLKLVTIVRKDSNYYAMIAYDEPEKHLMQTGLNDMNTQLKMVDTIKYFVNRTKDLVENNVANVKSFEIKWLHNEPNYYHLAKSIKLNSDQVYQDGKFELGQAINYLVVLHDAVIKDLSLTEKQRKVQNIVTNIFLNNMKCC